MSKQEFINRLQAALNGRVSPAAVAENVNYYEDYINTQIRLGKSEEEVLESLGDPRLIARTIVETSGKDARGTGTAGAYSDSYYRQPQGDSRYDGGQDRKDRKNFRIHGWMWTLVISLIVILGLSFVFSMVSFLAPVLIPILFVLFLVKLFRDWLN